MIRMVITNIIIPQNDKNDANISIPHSEDMIGEVAIPPARKLEDLIRSVDFMFFDFIWSVAYISVDYL